LNYHQASHTNHLGIFARNAIATLSYHNRGCPSKHQITKEEVSLNSLIMNQILSNHLLSRAVLSFNTSVTQIHYVLELLKLSSIMLLLANIDLDSFLRRTLGVHVVYILSSLGDTSCMSVKDSIAHFTLFFEYNSNIFSFSKGFAASTGI